MSTLLPSSLYSTFLQEDKQIWGKLSSEGRAMLIKHINASVMKTTTPETRLSSSHGRIEVNVSQQDDKDDILSTVLERIFSPGQLELQRKVALAQASRKTENIQPKNTSDTVREVRIIRLHQYDVQDRRNGQELIIAGVHQQ